MKKPERSQKRTRSSVVTITGVLRPNSRGFGFVTHDGGPDLFIPAPMMSGYIDGDTVEVDTVDGNSRSIRLVDRVRTVVFGRVRGGKFEVDPGVGQLSFPLKGDFDADEIVSVRLGSRDGSVTGTVVRRLGHLDDALTIAEVMLDRHQLPLDHSTEIESEGRAIASQATKGRSNPLRRDLRDQLVVTIDAPHSQDLDDAVAAQVDPDGHIRVWVHIADVSEHVTAGSALDEAAHTVPTSVYMPDYVRPMLPAVLAHDVLSLLPGTDRDTLTVEMRISPNGSISAVDVYESKICTTTRLSYSTVAKILDGRRGKNLDGLAGEELTTPVIDTIGWLWAAATRLGQQRAARGGVDAFRVDMTPGQESRDDNAHLLIERLMVAANESVARWQTERGVPTLYRVHDPIDNESAEELEKIADAFGVKAHLGRPVTAQAFAAFAASLDKQRSAGLWDAILGLLGRARYSVDATGHFGLGADQYLHFTSPIRRYADLRVHRLVKAYLHGERVLDGVRTELNSVAADINPVLRRADMAMRDADRSAALAKVSLKKRSHNGVITSVTSRGLSVLTPLSHVAVFVPSRALGKGGRIEQGRRVLIASDGRSYGVGARIELRVTEVDVLAGRIEGSLSRSAGGESETTVAVGKDRTGTRPRKVAATKRTAGEQSEVAKPKRSTTRTPRSKPAPVTAASDVVTAATENRRKSSRRATKPAGQPQVNASKSTTTNGSPDNSAGAAPKASQPRRRGRDRGPISDRPVTATSTPAAPAAPAASRTRQRAARAPLAVVPEPTSGSTESSTGRERDRGRNRRNRAAKRAAQRA